MKNESIFRFYGALNDFLPKSRKNNWISYHFYLPPAVKDAIEAIGIPHPEIGLIIINGEPVDFYRPLQPQDKVEAYPITTGFGLPAHYKLRPALPAYPQFVLDVHLGKLAKLLRLLGFDTCYRNDYADETIAQLAARENRIVLTRDIGLLKHKIIYWGYWLRSQHPPQQLTEILAYFNLYHICRPLTRCLACNGCLYQVEKEDVIKELPPNTRLYFNEFFRCPDCRRLFWKGSHYDHMLSEVAKIIPAELLP